MLDNFIYISTDEIRNMVVARGITSADFIEGLKTIPQNIVLLNDDRKHANGLNAHTKFSTIQGKEAVKAYLLDDTINDKKIVDFKDNASLDALLDSEIADLLYLSHMGYPLHQAFSSKLQNHYIYMMMKANFTRVYYRDPKVFNTVLNVCICRHLKHLLMPKQSVQSVLKTNVWDRFSHHHETTPHVKSLTPQMLKKLGRLTAHGMIIAFDEMQVDRKQRLNEIPLLVEKYPDTQSTWYYKQDIYKNTVRVGTLIYRAGTQRWQLKTSVQD